QLEITSTTATVKIIGTGSTGAGASIIDAASTSRIFQVDAGTTVVLQNLEIAHGQAEQGGGTYSSGNLPLDQVTPDSHKANGQNGVASDIRRPTPGDNGQGGALYVAGGSAALTNSTLSNDTAHGGKGGGNSGSGLRGGAGQGGALYVAGGSVALTNCTLWGD